MPQVDYRGHSISYTFIRRSLKYHYISVDKEMGVVLKGRRISEKKANELILKKARWILRKLEQVEKQKEEQDIRTGSELPLLGKYYPVEVLEKNTATKLSVHFSGSKLTFTINPVYGNPDGQIRALIDIFYHNKSVEEMPARIEAWSEKTGLHFNRLKFRKKKRQWASCSSRNDIIFNTYAVKLAPDLIDYLIVHELCHTVEKNHSKEFYEEVARHLPGWKALNGRLKKEVIGL